VIEFTGMIAFTTYHADSPCVSVRKRAVCRGVGGLMLHYGVLGECNTYVSRGALQKMWVGVLRPVVAE
jgi:hypothetical protein